MCRSWCPSHAKPRRAASVAGIAAAVTVVTAVVAEAEVTVVDVTPARGLSIALLRVTRTPVSEKGRTSTSARRAHR